MIPVVTGTTAVVVTAGLLIAVPSTDSDVADIPPLEGVEMTSVPVGKVGATTWSAGEVAAAAKVPVDDDVSWPKIGQDGETELTTAWTQTGVDGVEIRATEKPETEVVVELSLAGRGTGADDSPLGLLLDISTTQAPAAPGSPAPAPSTGPDAAADESAPAPDDATQTEPTPSPTDADPTPTPTAQSGASVEPASFRRLDDPDVESTPTPEPTTSPDSAPTPTPPADQQDSPTDEDAEGTPEDDTLPAEEADPAEDVPMEIRVDYAEFANAMGGDWSGRLALWAVEDCDADAVENISCEDTMSQLPSQNHVGDQQVTASMPAETFASGGYVALMAGDAGGTGDFTATSMTPSSSWAAGGNTGEFTWSYPITTPPAVGGEAPQLALNYSSGSVDGLTASTNAQSSWVGEGFSLEPGFIERSYRPCYDDRFNTHNVPSGYTGGDLCWRDWNASISFNGKSSPLVPVDTSDTDRRLWRMKNDDGTRIERLTRSQTNPQRNEALSGEYWVVTTVDGTKAYFGQHRVNTTDSRRTNSVSTVPVYGNHAGDRCYNASFAVAKCNDMPYRWALDYVVDPDKNTTTYFYSQERNRYGINENSGAAAYDRAATLRSIEYGTREGDEHGGAGGNGNPAPAPARVIFGTAERCIPTSTFACDPDDLNQSTSVRWHDVPFDRICISTSSCATRHAPTFFQRKRLTTVKSQVWNGSNAYTDVDSYTLSHSFPDAGGTPRSLWMTQVKREGLPLVKFAGTLLENRVDSTGDSMSPFSRWRLSGINNGAGGSTSVTYSAQGCSAAEGGKPNSTQLHANNRRCFPTYYQPSHADDPLLEFFHKYLVTSVTEQDHLKVGVGVPSASDPVVTTYEYGGGAAWRYDSSTIPRPQHRTWNNFRGYEWVATRTGDTEGRKTYSRSYYLRGMHNNRIQGGGTATVNYAVPGWNTITDWEHFAGFPVRTETRLGSSSADAVTIDFAEPWRSPTPTATDNVNHQARMTGPGTDEAWGLTSGGQYRKTRSITTYDEYGLPVQVADSGDIAIGSDDQCTKTRYARDLPSWRLNYAYQSVTTAGACATPYTSTIPSITDTDDVIAADRTYYDGSNTLGALPGRGAATRSDSADGLSSGAITYQTDTTRTVDDYGRVTSETNALGQPVTTTYTPATGHPTQVQQSTTLAAGTPQAQAHTTTTTLERTRGLTTQVVDPAGGITSYEYDSLGRKTKIWIPERPKVTSEGAGNPTYLFDYRIADGSDLTDTDDIGVNVVTTQTLSRDHQYVGAAYLTSYEFYDGKMRLRGTQSPAHSDPASGNPRGRVITENVYDGRGLKVAALGPYFNDSPASSTMVATLAINELPKYVNYTYDGAGRTLTERLGSGVQTNLQTTTYGYAADRTTVTPPAGGTPTATVADARGQTRELLQYKGSTPTGTNHDTLAYAYTPGGQLKTVENQAGTQWSQAYDIRGNRTSIDDPDAGLSTTTYDALDRPVTTTDAEGRKLHTTYDGLGRKTAVRNTNATGSLRTSWTYDTLRVGALTSSTRHTPSGTYTNEVTGYDAAGRALGASLKVPSAEGTLHRPGGYVEEFTYTDVGDIRTHTLPAAPGLGQETLSYGYTDTGLFRSLGGNGSIISGSTYDAFGQIDTRRRIENVVNVSTETFTREAGTDRVTQHRVTLDGSVISDRNFTYNPRGDVLKTRDLNAEGSTPDTQCFEYDYLRRLTEARTSNTDVCTQAPSTSTLGSVDPYWHSYTYSASGNRTSWTERFEDDGAIQTREHAYAYPAASADRPHAVQAVTSTGFEADSESFTYDATGAMSARESDGGQELELDFDVEGRVASATDPVSGESVEYVYDADGKRLLERDESTGTTTLYAGITEYVRDDATDTVTASRFYSVGGQPVAVRTAAGLEHVVSDAQGTGTLQIDVTDKSFVKRRYAPFGIERDPAGAPGWVGDRGFLDKTRDELMGTTHVGAREYDPRLGRFLSVDPIADFSSSQQLNAYGYANNNPVAFFDPSGLFAESPNAAATAERMRSQSSAMTRSSIGMKYNPGRQFCGARCGFREVGPNVFYRARYQELLRDQKQAGRYEQLISARERRPSVSLAEFGSAFIDGLLWGGTRDACGNDATSLSCVGNAAFDGGATILSFVGLGILANGARAGVRGARAARNVEDAVPPRFITTGSGVTIDRASVSTRVSVQRQGRHVLGNPLHRGGGYFHTADDAQRVLDDFHSGAAQVLGVKGNDIVVRAPGISGVNVNRASGHPRQVTNVFFIKGTRSPSVVPFNPRWKP